MPHPSPCFAVLRACLGATVSACLAAMCVGLAALAMVLASSYLLGGPAPAAILYGYCVGGAGPLLAMGAAAALAAQALRGRRDKSLVPVPAARRRRRPQQRMT